MRHGKDTKGQATALIEAMRRSGVPAFHIDTFVIKAKEEIQDMIRLAKSLHRIFLQ